MTQYSNSELQTLDQSYYLQTFKRFPIAIEKGKGSYLWDVEGNKYLDMLAGIAVNNVGYSHPKVVKAIQDQAEKITHISNFFVRVPQVELSEKLREISKLDRVFFTNSGAESLEGAIKIARKYAHSKGRGGTIVSFENSFHGRTLATIATGKEAYQKGFGPIPSGFVKVPFNDIEAVKAACNSSTAAVVIEPVQGEGGINVADKAFLHELKAFCDQEDIVLIFDEVQSGIGRTGHWFAKDHYGIQPNILTSAKGLGGGVPIGAVISDEKVSSAIDFGDHGTTFGGNPLVCAAALATIEVIEKENLLENVQNRHDTLVKHLENLNEPSIKEIRGLGLMMGVEFDFEAKPLVLDLLENGVIANATAGNVLRIVPPLNVSDEEIEAFFKVLKQSLENIKENA
ncbi:aspartate aminotransferase family protein [bacterium]|nr:aspartate aminotransferase family protein [bacterium]